MTDQINAYKIGLDYKAMYGIDTNKLGCIMLNTDSPLAEYDVQTPTAVEFDKMMKRLEDNQYFSPNLKHVKGIVEDHHVTVRYGLLPEVAKTHVKQIVRKCTDLHGPLNSFLRLAEVEVWPSTNDEEYECVVVRVKDDRLKQWYEYFGMLPNLVTFPEYKPHITIGYFKPGTWEPIYDEQIKLVVGVRDWKYGSTLR